MLIRPACIDGITYAHRIDPLYDRILQMEEKSIDVKKQLVMEKTAPGPHFIIYPVFRLQRRPDDAIGLLQLLRRGGGETTGGAGIKGDPREDLLQQGYARCNLVIKIPGTGDSW